MSTLSTLPLTTITGEPSTLEDFAGQVVLIVNVASKCGLTPQYTALEALYQRYKDQGFAVLGFPSNDFAGQEPGSNADIATFCSTEYPVTFPLFAKTPVNGKDQHPLYKMLKKSLPTAIPFGPWREGLEKYAAANNFPPPAKEPEILWNFEKFLLSRDETPLARFAPDMPPDDQKIIAAIEKALA